MFRLLTNLLRFFAARILGITTGQNFPPPLSRAEEWEQFRKLKETGDETARATLIEHNLRLVAHIVRKYYAGYQNPDELISIGSLGLIKAIDSFKAENGARFATYGAKCIQNEILMFFRAQKKRQGEISLSETIDIDRDGNPLTYMDIISDEGNIPAELDRRMITGRLMHLIRDVLDEREREVIVLRYGLGGATALTQKEVAGRLGISRSYVSRIEKKSLEKLNDAFGGIVPDFSEL